MRTLRTLAVSCLIGSIAGYCPADDWRPVYSESFDQVPVGSATGSKVLVNWEGGSAAGRVFDGGAKAVGRFLVASSAWTSFNQGPIFNPHCTPA